MPVDNLGTYQMIMNMTLICAVSCWTKSNIFNNYISFFSNLCYSISLKSL